MSVSQGSSSWQRRRSAFNHDWLKNRYLTALDAWLSILDGDARDEQMEASFVRSFLPEWEANWTEAEQLIGEFTEKMSPKVLFDVPPLSRCDEHTKGWLPDLIHGLWLYRHGIEDLVAQASERLREARHTYQRLQKALADVEPAAPVETLRPLRDDFAQFRTCCGQLGKAISQFPGKVLVT